MLGLAGNRLGLESVFLDPADAPPAATAGRVIRAGFDDDTALRALANDCDVITYEFENVPVDSIHAIESICPVFPPAAALRCAQDRLSEKQLFESLSIPLPGYRVVDSEDDLADAARMLGLPLIVKTRRFGYDGKGQAVLRKVDEIAALFRNLGGKNLIAEQFVKFDREVSAIAARSVTGNIVFYPLAENVHRDGILRTSIAPADTGELSVKAQTYLERMLCEFQYVGVMALELFVIGGELFANEFAPRVHNSGHWTIEGSTCSQFENHMRAVSGMPLINPEIVGYPGMLNIIGSMPSDIKFFESAGAVLHDYGKAPRPGRKLAHATVLGKTELDRKNRLERLSEALSE